MHSCQSDNPPTHAPTHSPAHPTNHLNSHGRALQIAQKHGALGATAKLHKLPLLINNKLQAGATWVGRGKGWKACWLVQHNKASPLVDV